MSPLIQGLLRPEAYDHPVAGFEVLETHISWVILTGEFAYKLKKPVDFGFVNFTTLERRKWFCEEELRLNRRLAADLYLNVVPVCVRGGLPEFVGAGTPIDYAVKMRQFDQPALLPQVLSRGELRPDQLDQFADVMAEFQAHAAVAGGDQEFGEPDAVRLPVTANLEALAKHPDFAEEVARLREWSDREFARLELVFRERKRLGRVRECHGDLHLGNLVLQHDRIAAFDCLEFNAGLRWIDVVSEIAFLVMDLAERGQPELANRVLNRWLEQTGDYAGLATWRWYFVYRTLVRAKVAWLRSLQTDQSAAALTTQQAEVSQYLCLAITWTQPRRTAVIITHGVSGSGKSFLAQEICQHLGAIRIRSDVERKRQFGLWGIPRVATRWGNPYAPDVSRSLYGTVLLELAEAVVQNGFPVIVDAAFLNRADRERFRELAERLRVPWLILDVSVEPDVARQRILQRQLAGGDPSDADASILDRQLQSQEPLTGSEQLFAVSGSDPDAVWQELRRRLDW